MKAGYLFFILVLTSSLSEGQTCENLKGSWKNQQGSTLEINSFDDNTGEIRGKYRSDSGTDGNFFPLIGWVNSRKPEVEKDHAIAISFSVRWGEIGSITSWSGTCKQDESGNPEIKTIWNLVRPVTDYEWDHILTNTATFKPSGK